MERNLFRPPLRLEKLTAAFYPTLGLDSEALEQLFRLNGWPPTDLDYGMEFNWNPIAVTVPVEQSVHRRLVEARASVLDADQAADLLGTSRRVIEGIAKQGRFGRKVGRDWRFSINGILSWLTGSQYQNASTGSRSPNQKSTKQTKPVESWDWSDKERNLSKGLNMSADVGYSDGQGKVPDCSSRKGGSR